MSSSARPLCFGKLAVCIAFHKPCTLPVTFGRREAGHIRSLPSNSKSKNSLGLPETSSDVTERPSKLQEAVQKLRSYGPAGIAAYGVLTTVYYAVVVAFVWLAVLHVQPGGGWQLASRKLAEAFASAWAISQITKIPRALGALFLAPFADKAMNWIIEKTWFQSKGQVLAATVLVSITFALLVAGSLVLTAL